MIRTTLISTDEIKLETRDGGFLFLHWSDIMAVSSVALTDDYQKFVVKVHLANGNVETLKGFYTAEEAQKVAKRLFSKGKFNND